VAAVGQNPATVEYQARIEYLVKTRTAEELKGDKTVAAITKKGRNKSTRGAKKAKKADGDGEPGSVSSAVDIAIHAAEMDFLQNGQTVVQSRITRDRFQGRLMPEMPVLTVRTAGIE
jgi:hypothetical protein